MNKIKTLYVSLLLAFIFLSTSCSTQSSIYGLWQDTKEAGTIEFKLNGEMIIVDNMSTTVTGKFKIQNDNLITFELMATDIMNDSIQPISKTIVTAKIIKINDNELQLSFSDETEVEHYKRIP